MNTIEYFIQPSDGKLNNEYHDISYEQIKLLFEDNLREAKESCEITESTYRGENYYDKHGDTRYALHKEYLLRDPKTAGMRMYYPHGIVIEQSARRNYYRGENQVYPSSIPSLLRTLNRYGSVKEKEMYRLVADMRIAEFMFFLQKFQHVQEWKISDVLFDVLAQHYGLETGWLDITNDFNVALFFATCYWDNGKWKPLSRKQTEIDENHQYGIIFHMPSNCMVRRWSYALSNQYYQYERIPGKNSEDDRWVPLKHPRFRGNMENLSYPLGFQPFMRCHMQNGYGIYMRTPHPLQEDLLFEKLRFRHSEELSKAVFELMKGGELIYPHEGIREANFVIDQIKQSCSFSKEAFRYALYRSHYYKLENEDIAKADLNGFCVDGRTIQITERHPWHLSAGRRKKIDEKYSNFSVESWYHIRVLERKGYPAPTPMFEPWMIPEENDGQGVEDFKLRSKVECGVSIVDRDYFNLMDTLITAKIPDF